MKFQRIGNIKEKEISEVKGINAIWEEILSGKNAEELNETFNERIWAAIKRLTAELASASGDKKTELHTRINQLKSQLRANQFSHNSESAEFDDIDAEYLTESDDEKHMNRKIIAGATGVAIVGLASLYSGIKGLIKQHREAKTAEKKAIIAQHIAKMRAQIAKKKAAAHKK